MTEQEIEICYAYLKNNWSHRKIEKDIIENDGRGYKAMEILHKFGLKGEHKNLLKQID